MRIVSSDTNTDRGDEPGRNLESGLGEPHVSGSEPAGVMEAAPGIAVEYRILGPIEVERAGRVAQLRGRGPRVLLCTLLLNRNRAVSVDRLIEALWGESAPPTATKTVQVYVSQLRKAMAALGGAAEQQLETHGHGYLLACGGGAGGRRPVPGARRAGTRATGGRRFRGGGDAPGGGAGACGAGLRWPTWPTRRRRARRSLAWTSCESPHSRSASTPILDCGRHAELIPELQGLVGQHPTRERLRGELMLALYRSGRQAEAVNAYADARRALSEELGIEPGAELRDLERRVLAHDPTLAPPRRPRLAAAGDGLRRRWLLLAGAALLLAAAVAAAAVELTSGGTQAGIASLAGDSVGLIEPTSGRIVGQFPLGATPSQVVAGEHAMWTANTDQSIVARVDLTTGDIATDRHSHPHGARSRSGVAVGILRHAAGQQRFICDPPASPRPEHARSSRRRRYCSRRGHDRPEGARRSSSPLDMSGSRPSPGKLIGVDPASGRTRTVRIVDPRFGAVSLTGMAALNGAIWALTDARWVVRIDPHSGAVTRATELSLISFGTMTAGAGSLWVTDPRVRPGMARRAAAAVQPPRHHYRLGRVGHRVRRRRRMGDQRGRRHVDADRSDQRAPAQVSGREHARRRHRLGGRRVRQRRWAAARSPGRREARPPQAARSPPTPAAA